MITYRQEKGSPLTIEEMDGNFYEIAKRLQQVEETGRAEGIAHIQVDDGQMTLTGTQGTTFGPFALPIVILNPRGFWTARSEYARYDVVCTQDSAYVCKIAHTSAEDFEVNQDHWQLLLQVHQESAPEQAVISRLQIFEPQTLPKLAPLGHVALFVDGSGSPQSIYSDGKFWREIATNKILKP